VEKEFDQMSRQLMTAGCQRCRVRLSQFALSLFAALGVAVCSVQADIDVTLIPVDDVVPVGDIVMIGVVVSSDSKEDQLMSAMQMIFAWDTDVLQLIGLDQTGAVNLLFSGFPADPYGINESNPPKDGLGLYQALAPLGNPVAATPEGTLLTTLLFEALDVAPKTWIEIVPSAGDPVGHTIVFDGTTPNTDVTGVLTDASVTIVSACPWDLDQSGVVDGGDLLALLAAWGNCDDPQACPADFDGDGVVDGGDLLKLLSAWGPCP
jgi:hypothetical protein